MRTNCGEADQMNVVGTIKKEIALQISKVIPITIRKGPCKECKIYGNLFYNRRSNDFSLEEYLYEKLDLRDRTIVEAGAHVGVYTVLLSRRAINGKILAFEPNPLNYWFLKRNIKKNKLSNVLMFNIGLSNRREHLSFKSRRYNTGKGTFKKNKHELMKGSGDPIMSKTIPVTTTDEVLEECRIGRVDFVKIDTEGFESQVIEGMLNTIRNWKPLVYFEVHGLNIRERQDDLERIWQFLTKYGYTIVKLEKGLPTVTEAVIEKGSGGGHVAFCDKLQLGINEAFQGCMG